MRELLPFTFSAACLKQKVIMYRCIEIFVLGASFSKPIQNYSYWCVYQYHRLYRPRYRRYTLLYRFQKPIQMCTYLYIVQDVILYRHRYKRYTFLYRSVSVLIQFIIMIYNKLSTILYRFRRELRAREKTIQAVSLFLEHAAWSTRSPLLCSEVSVVCPRSSIPYLSRLTGSVEPTHEGHWADSRGALSRLKKGSEIAHTRK